MTDAEIHNIYLHMSGKAEGIAEVTGSADFPVLFARAILEFGRMEREWVGLSKEEIDAVFWIGGKAGEFWWERKQLDAYKIAQAIEAKLKEKNHV